MDDIKQVQKEIIDSINEELLLKNEYEKPSGFLHSVWFHPKTGSFLYNDTFQSHEVIQPLIETGELIFTGIENHQDEKMVRYTIPK